MQGAQKGVGYMKKTAIIYKSGSGNTKEVAQAVKDALDEQEVVYFGEPSEGIEADVYLVGSWTDKGMCVKEIADFLETLRNKKVGYFGTAGFGGSTEYYQALGQRAAEHIDGSNEFLGCFFCQGKMPMGVRNRYVQMLTEHPEDRKMQVNIENFDKALTHPDAKDLEDARAWAKRVTE